ncbi:lactate 2-monooxygenase [uncultured Microscilla sp.]|uniref:lactate 2-monooxygenase n=1 Tax=uncultured Microscilla sp. TaxID=432653 RepID=UPI00261C644B|nr:lactate 2-monooxygenase [uncultured Microscilla sp.]
MKFKAINRQRIIYTSGASGKTPLVPVTPQLLEEKAARRMTKEAAGYIIGGAGLGKTMQNNRSAFDQYQIVPRMLKDVSKRDTSITLFGQKLPSPLLTAPIGVLEMVHQRADLAVAEATSSLGVPMIFSNQASYPMEACASLMGNSPRWFQLYWSKSDELVLSFIKRAEVSGCSAIVVTLDTSVLGWRTHDLDLAFLPFLQGKGIAQYTSDPVFQQLMDEPIDTSALEFKPKVTLSLIKNALRMKKNYPGGLWKNLSSDRPIKAVKKFVNIYSRDSLTWENLQFLRKHTQLPLLLKGILHPDDAQKAIDYGMDGIVVSNHGGRQVDGAIGSFSALPDIVQTVKGQIPVLLDSGVRSGADMLKALAIGAKAVCLGRPYVYGLALAGAAGVQEVLANLMADFELNMALAGCASIDELGRGLLKGSGG